MQKTWEFETRLVLAHVHIKTQHTLKADKFRLEGNYGTDRIPEGNIKIRICDRIKMKRNCK